MQGLMNIYFSRYQQLTISSIEIAKNTGQNHDDVIKECDVLNSCYKKLAFPLIEERLYITPNAKNQQREFLLTREQQSHLFILNVVDNLNDDSKQLVQHLLTQQKGVVSKKTKDVESESKPSKKDNKKSKTKEPKEPKPQKIKTAKPKKQEDNKRAERGLISMVDVLNGTGISRGVAYSKLQTAQVIETITYTVGSGKSYSYYAITEKYIHLGFNEKLKNSAKATQPLWFEAKRDEILNMINSVK